jgi:subfamily B ATP-binding cassette protein MsbA
MTEASTATADRGSWPIYRRLLGWSRRYWPLLVLGMAGMLVEAGAAAAFTWLMQPMIDESIVAKNAELRWTLPGLIVALFVVRGIATFATDYGMARAGRSVVRDLRVAVLDKMLRWPGARFDQEPVASLVSRLNHDTEQVAQATSDAIKIVLTDTLTVVALLGVMLWHSWEVSLTILLIVPFIALLSNTVAKRYRMLNRRLQEGVGQLAHAGEETLAAQQEVKLFGRQREAVRRYAGLADHNLRLALKVESTRGAASSMVQLLAAIALAALLLVASIEASRGGLSAGGFVSIMIAMMTLIPSLKRLANVQGIVQRGVAAAERLFAVLDEVEEAAPGLPLDRARGELVFDRVGLRYPGAEQAALADVSFTCRPGTVTAIVGRSGSGKTSLIRLLPRFYEPSSGRILLDGRPLADYALPDLRRQIALVGQQVMLFDDSIAANIAFGAADREVVSAPRLEQAAAAANALEFIDQLPQGFATPVGDKGGRLSGGQRQRLAIARAVLKDAPILILDEATAALDNRSERLVQQALERLIPDRTTLVIAHRLSTVEHADQVVVMEQGRVVEVGTHAELLARGGAYAALHRAQFRDEPA